MLYLEEIRVLLDDSGIAAAAAQLEQLEAYYHYLREENARVNLISRQCSESEVWRKHILDSLLILKVLRFKEETVLDFGTGGGLPGIPLKILYPGLRMHLLDSRGKKMEAVSNIIKKLDLQECFPITSRLEELDEGWNSSFELILSRSVRMEKEYKRAMFQLLKEGGRIYLYKSHKIDDLEIFPGYRLYDISHSEVGFRQLIEIKKGGVS